MIFLLERDREAARSRFEKAREAAARAQTDHETAAAASDTAFDLWERATQATWDARKEDAQAKGDATTKACLHHIKAIGVLQDCKRALDKLEDPQELGRRMGVAETHEDWWRSRR